MALIYAQLLPSSLEPWTVVGTPESTTVALHADLTLNYADASTDTIPAGTVTASFDRASDVWVIYTVPGSLALSMAKESALDAITGDWCALVRCAYERLLPWQQGSAAAGSFSGALTTDCLTFPNNQEICGDTPDELHYTMDDTAGEPAVHKQTIDAYILPSGHEIQALGASGDDSLPTPSDSPTLATSGSSSWDAGTASVVYTWTDGSTESSASPAATITIADGDGISVTVPSFPTGITGFYAYITRWQLGTGTRFYYADEVLADSPIFYLPLNEPTGRTTVIDFSGNAHNGTVTGSPFLGSTLGCLRGQRAIEMHDSNVFDSDLLMYVSTGDTVDVGALTSLPRTDSWTVEGWASVPSAPEQAVILKWGTPGDYNSLIAFQLFISPTTFTVQATAGSTAWATNYSGYVGLTYHIAATWDAGTSTMDLFVNGVSIGPNTLSPTGASTFSSPTAQIGGPMNVGQGYPNVRLYSNSVMDDIALYPTALSSARILAHYQAGVQGIGRAALAGSSPTIVTALDSTCATPPDTGGLVARDPSGALLWRHDSTTFTVYAPAGNEFITFG